MKVILVLLLGLLVGCQQNEKLDHRLSTVEIKKLEEIDYQTLGVKVFKGEEEVINRSFEKDQENIEVTMKPGSYRFVLDYWNAETKVASSEFCQDKSAEFEISPGPNTIEIFVCGADSKEPIACNVEQESGPRHLRLLTKIELKKYHGRSPR